MLRTALIYKIANLTTFIIVEALLSANRHPEFNLSSIYEQIYALKIYDLFRKQRVLIQILSKLCL